MTNENKNSNELVAEDDDPTAELEALTVRYDGGHDQATGDKLMRSESEAGTHDFDGADSHDGATIAELQSDLLHRSDTIERLQYDIEQLRSKWIGLETEIKAREELTSNLNTELKSSNRGLARKEKLLQKRDRAVKSLKAEIREREGKYRDLQQANDEILGQNQELETGDEISTLRQRLAAIEGRLATSESRFSEAESQQKRTEQYADQLRRKLADISSSSEEVAIERETLASELAGATERIDSLTVNLCAANDARETLATTLENIEKAHAEEIRLLRFDLGEAEETLAQSEHISEQLASDLVDTRGFRNELERMLQENDKQNTSTLEGLKKKLKTLETKLADNEQKLETKSEAINCLLGELARKSQEIDSVSEIEDVIHELDDRMSERIAEHVPVDRERVTRLLIGRVDEQEVRFPLFKNRLTIGRTKQNDIQLKAQYISRRHAVITTEGDAARVIDWGSKNGVYVNSRRVSEHFLKHGDIVTIGAAEFRYEELPKRDL